MQVDNADPVYCDQMNSFLIHLAKTKFNALETERDSYFQINAEIPHKLSLLAKSINALCAYASTECVFDGTQTV